MASKGRGFSCHVGVNSPYPGRFTDGRFPDLHGCDAAAGAMEKIARERGFTETSLRVSRAETARSLTLEWFAATAVRAERGDLVLFTFAGHGDRVPDHDGDEDEDQAIVLSDDQLIDDEMFKLLAEFKEGVRVVLVVESCYSGSMVWTQMLRGILPFNSSNPPIPPVWNGLGRRRRVAADVVLLAATTDQTTAEGATKAADLPPFTQKLIEKWEESQGRFDGGYRGLASAVGCVLNDDLVTDGGFVESQPFGI